MATAVYTVEDITLQDGTEVTLKPLNIKGLRKFMSRFKEFTEVDTEEEGVDILVDCAAICLMKTNINYWDKTKDRGETKPDAEGNTTPKEKGGASEDFEDVADMPTVYKIIEVCGGIKLNDPNLTAAVEALGKTST